MDTTDSAFDAKFGKVAVPEPVWRSKPRATKAPRVPLTREAIVEAALRVLDRHGIEKLSMRQVSEELGTGPASLYWHVRNKGELFQLITEHVTGGGIELPEPDPARWMQQLEELAAQMRAVMTAHRDLARLSMGRIPFGPTTVRITEWLFQLLTPLGIPDKVIAYSGDLFGLYVGAYAFEESLGAAAPTGENIPAEDINEMFREYLTTLPVAQFPQLHRVGDQLFDTDTDGRFEFGMKTLLYGLRAYITVDPAGAEQRPDGDTHAVNNIES